MLLAANWKMNKTTREAADFVKHYAVKLPQSPVPTVILAPFTALESVARAVREAGLPGDRLAYGSQNVYFESSGAFTGEVSADMLLEFGCRYAICGHSERRQIFGESDELIGRKVLRLLEVGMVPIFCIGETLPERESGKLEEVLTRQLSKGLAGVKPQQLPKTVIAYEPVWAIGTGVVATPQQAQDAHKFVRDYLSEHFGSQAAGVPILYGGSVKPDNADSLMSRPDIDGALVGGASLKAESLIELHSACMKTADKKKK